jgi:predicted dithiol-disulfide oxidoreductase (DUF899 family)
MSAIGKKMPKNKVTSREEWLKAREAHLEKVDWMRFHDRYAEDQKSTSSQEAGERHQ